jgi:hypothetical protein
MIILDYTYEIKDFVNSRYFGSCYNNNNSLFTDSGYTLDISGRFYCYYGDSIDISVITKDKVIDENADEVKAHTYTWHLDSADYNNQQILLEVEYDNSIPVWIIYGSIVIVGIIVIIFMMYFILKNRFNNAI